MTLSERIAAFLRPVPAAQKAVTGAGVVAMTYDPPLYRYAEDPQRRAQQYLAAYRVGWFYKAEHKIATDFASLSWHVSEGDDDSNESQDSLPVPDLSIPFESLTPIEQFMRLMERPNPSQTGRQLFEKAQIRLDMAGWTFLYLENGTGVLPTAIYGISPARMWPAYDKGGSLIGWVMDKDSPRPVAFEAAEIMLIAQGSEADTPYGVGAVEAVQQQVPLTGLMARHTANVLTTGGRMAGMITPKDRALDENEFQDVQRAWRNVASDENAARRLLIFPEPMEWTSGSATPQEIGIPELAVLNRDEILTAFPISPYMLGVPMPGGLNSAEMRREERRSYWEGTIHPRVDVWEEAIKVNLLSRYEALTGRTYDFDFEEPALDDATGLIEKAAALKALADLGFDETEAVRVVGLDHVKFNGIPAPTPVVQDPNAPGAGPTVTVQGGNRRDQVNTVEPVSGKAQPTDARDRVVDPANARYAPSLARFLAEQQDRVARNIRDTLPLSKAARMKADPSWWDQAAEDAALTEVLQPLYVEVGRGGLQTVADRLNRTIVRSATRNVVDDILTYGGQRIVGINETTRKAISDTLAEGVRRGYSINQIIDGKPDEQYTGIRAAVMDNGSPVFDDLRAETITRTETMLSYNRSSLTGYGEFGVQTVVAYDGDMDDECASRDGREFPVIEALDIQDHPNGTLDWAPVMDKAAHDDPLEAATKMIAALPAFPDIHVHIPTLKTDVQVDAPTVTVEPSTIEPVFNITTPEHRAYINVEPATIEPIIHVAAPQFEPHIIVEATEPPTVNVAAPDVHIDPAEVNVAAPEVHVAAPTVYVDAPTVNVAPPDVTVEAPHVTVEAAKVDVPATVVNVTPTPVVVEQPAVQDVRVVDNTLPRRKQRVKRDLMGRVDSIEEE